MPSSPTLPLTPLPGDLLHDAMLDAVGTAAVFLADSDLQLLFANPRAIGQFGRDMPLRLHNGRLHATSGAGQVLAQLVRGAAADGLHAGPPRAARSLPVPRSGRQPLTLTVAPFWPGGAAGATSCAIVMARDPETVAVSCTALRQLFDLTQAEAAVAQALSVGAAEKDIAATLCVSINTVKTHLHHIYAKTCTHRQGELIALIHGSTATLDMAHPNG